MVLVMKFNSISFLFVILVGSVPATWGQEQTTTKEQLASGGLDITQDNYGAYPKPDAGYVTDLANQLTDVQEEEIERWLWQTESRTGVEIAVVIIRSIQDYDTENTHIESFATGLFDIYGIGNLPKNDGVLLLIARGDRKARIDADEHPVTEKRCSIKVPLSKAGLDWSRAPDTGR